MLSSHSIEILAALAGLLNVYLAARENIWNWLFGGITVGLYIIIFFQVKLYADMGLQVIFLGLQFYGCFQWLYGNENRLELSVDFISKKDWCIAFFSFCIFFALLIIFLRFYTDSTTILLDAFTTALSLVGQWMMCKKWIENWIVWMLVDLISIKMYLIKHLYCTSLLYAVFFIICCVGYVSWKSHQNKNSQALTPFWQ